ncbi:MAG: efflux RND transporter periplasmic adaptor subunit [bacterium]
MKEKLIATIQSIKDFWKNLSKTKKWTLGIIILIVAVIIIKNDPSDVGVTIEAVSRRDLQQTVRASATVVSATDVSLGFDSAGTIQSMYVVVGDKVKKGDILARLDAANAKAAVTSAKGSLLLAQAKYKKVLDGSSNEEIAVAKADLQSAQNDLVQTTKTQEGLVANARKALFSDGLTAELVGDIAGSNNPIVSGTYTGDEGQYTINAQSTDYVSVSGIETGITKISTTSPQPLGTKGLMIVFPGMQGVAGSSWKIKIPNTANTKYTADNNAYIAAMNTKDQAISNAQSLVAQKQASLALKQATARQADVDSALAEVLTAQAGLESAQANLEHTILRAPADGTITSVEQKLGEAVQQQKEVVVLQDIKNLYLEAKISESNIGSIAVGQAVTINYDALPGQNFSATVSSIDPAAISSTDGTISYKVKILLADTTNIKPGMSANISILTKQVQNGLSIPKNFIQKKGNESGVMLVTDTKGEKTVYRKVETGIDADGGFVEILNGLSEGDKVYWKAAN